MAKSSKPTDINRSTSSALLPNEGLQLECRVMRFYARQRYFVRRSIIIHTEASLNQATDLDVVAVKWIAPFKKHLQIAECKSGSKEGPLDRIFWLTGVRKYTGADAATLFRVDTKWDIKQFARECGVQLIDLTTLEQLETQLKIDTDKWPGLADPYYFAANGPSWEKALDGDAALKQIWRFVQGEARWERPVLSIRYLLLSMRRIVRLMRADPAHTLYPVMLVNSLGHLVMFALSLTAQTFEMRSPDVKGLIYRDAKFGSTDKRVVDRFMRLARKITEDALHQAGVTAARIDDDMFNFPEPQNVDDIIAIQDAIREEAGVSEDLASFVDYVSWERFVHHRDGDEWISTVYGGDASALSKVAKEICNRLEHLGALPNGYGKIFESSDEPLRPELTTISAVSTTIDNEPHSKQQGAEDSPIGSISDSETVQSELFTDPLSTVEP